MFYLPRFSLFIRKDGKAPSFMSLAPTASELDQSNKNCTYIILNHCVWELDGVSYCHHHTQLKAENTQDSIPSKLLALAILFN